MHPEKSLRLFEKPGTPAAPKSASRPDPDGFIVRHKSNMCVVYIRISNLSRVWFEKIKLFPNETTRRIQGCPCGRFEVNIETVFISAVLRGSHLAIIYADGN
jgi:hypothetical protein